MIISDSGLITWTALEGILTSGLVTLSVSDGELSVTESFEVQLHRLMIYQLFHQLLQLKE